MFKSISFPATWLALAPLSLLACSSSNAPDSEPTVAASPSDAGDGGSIPVTTAADAQSPATGDAGVPPPDASASALADGASPSDATSSADVFSTDTGAAGDSASPTPVVDASADGSCEGACGDITLFGGGPGSTWTWSGSAWSPAFLGTSPTLRNYASAAPLGGKMVLYGGHGAGVALSDTWEWDGASWTQLSIEGPPGRWNAVAATFNGTVLLLGGEDFNTDSPPTDVWIFDGAAWAQFGDLPPRFQPMGAAELGGKLLVLGTGTEEDGGTDKALAQWEWDGNSWTQDTVATPPGRTAGTLSLFDGNELLLFGGQALYAAGSHALGDTWVWDGNYWAKLMVDGPSARAGASAAMEPAGSVILFGGSNLTGVPDATLTDTFRWDGATWTQLDVAGPPLLFAPNMCAL